MEEHENTLVRSENKAKPEEKKLLRAVVARRKERWSRFVCFSHIRS